MNKEEWLIRAMQNLRKHVNYLQLELNLANNIITEDDFDEEMRVNKHKYVLDLIKIEEADFVIICEIVQHMLLNESSIGDITQLFGVNYCDLEKFLQ